MNNHRIIEPTDLTNCCISYHIIGKCRIKGKQNIFSFFSPLNRKFFKVSNAFHWVTGEYRRFMLRILFMDAL